ncbi:hypothetical protein CAEBREN_11688 [Caenorhabditis brenneri]|uniref:Major sperm protein n=1 Tax=Caenorhabditis brenneri TaxID=135651 RepID=G0PA44_CAEBE|nr:hypothetical protein CAEBREN_11688 [Caenorhabditis brenneri]
MPDPSTPKESKPKDDVFELELTPSEPVVNPDTPLSMKIKNLTKETQAVVVEVESYLFEIKNPRATIQSCSQIYRKLEPGKTMRFKIRFVEKPKFESGQSYNEERLNKNPEGWLSVYHKTSMWSKECGVDNEWGFYEDEEEGRRIIPYCELKSYHGNVNMRLICEKETELTKKIREKIGRDYEEPKKKCSIM